MGEDEEHNKQAADMEAIKREFPAGKYTDKFRTYIYHVRRYMSGDAGQCQNCKISVDWNANECSNCHWPFMFVEKVSQKARLARKGVH